MADTSWGSLPWHRGDSPPHCLGWVSRKESPCPICNPSPPEAQRSLLIQIDQEMLEQAFDDGIELMSPLVGIGHARIRQRRLDPGEFGISRESMPQGEHEADEEHHTEIG